MGWQLPITRASHTYSGSPMHALCLHSQWGRHPAYITYTKGSGRKKLVALGAGARCRAAGRALDSFMHRTRA